MLKSSCLAAGLYFGTNSDSLSNRKKMYVSMITKKTFDTPIRNINRYLLKNGITALKSYLYRKSTERKLGYRWKSSSYGKHWVSAYST